MAAEAKVRLSVQGAQRVQQTLRGVRRDARAAGQGQQRTARDGARITERAERDKQQAMGTTDRLARRFSQGQLVEARRSAREQMRLSSQVQRQRVRDAERAAQREAALRRRLEQQSQTRGGGAMSRLGGAFAGAAVGGIAGGIASVSRARGVAGVQSMEQRIQGAANFDLGLRRLGVQAGLSDTERDELGQRIVTTSTQYGLDQNAVLGGIGEAQERFGQQGFEALSANLEDMAKASAALDVPLGDVVGMLGTFQTAMGLTAAQVRETMGLVVAASRDGSIEIRDFSRAFAGEIGAFAETTQTRGVAGVREFIGAAQAIGSGQYGADESATRLRAATSALSAGTSKDNLVKFLVRDKSTRDVGRRLRGGDFSLSEVAKALAGREDFTGVKAAEIFSEIRGRQGMQTLVAREREGSPVAASVIGQAQASTGQQVIAETFANVSQAAGFKFAQQAAEAQASITRNLDDYAEHVSTMTDAAMAFEKAVGEYGLYTEAFVGAVGGLGAVSLLKGLAGGGAAAGGATGGAAGVLGKLAPVAGKAALAGGAGLATYGAFSWMFEKSGANEKILGPLGEWIHELLNGSAEGQVNAKIESETARLAAQQLSQAERQTRALETLVRSAERGTIPGAGVPQPQPGVPGRSGR